MHGKEGTDLRGHLVPSSHFADEETEVQRARTSIGTHVFNLLAQFLPIKAAWEVSQRGSKVGGPMAAEGWILAWGSSVGPNKVFSEV